MDLFTRIDNPFLISPVVRETKDGGEMLTKHFSPLDILDKKIRSTKVRGSLDENVKGVLQIL